MQHGDLNEQKCSREWIKEQRLNWKELWGEL